MSNTVIYIIGCLFSWILGFIMCLSHMQERITPEIGNSIENMGSLKKDCEKDLPRDQECTLLYEFVPTKTKGE